MTNREEVAKKWRKTGERLDKVPPISLTGTACTTLFELLESAGIRDNNSYSDVFNRLADLIDPTCRIYYTDTSTNTPETGYEPDGYYSCSCCGELHDLFAEAWDDYQAIYYEGEPPFRYCPNCGARVVRDEA